MSRMPELRLIVNLDALDGDGLDEQARAKGKDEADGAHLDALGAVLGDERRQRGVGDIIGGVEARVEQGVGDEEGTFLNDAVLRSMERIIGKNVVRPDIAGIMGAYGAAIVAKENYVEGTKSSILGPEELDAFTIENSHARCGRCENNCLLTINKFSDGSKYITGNRCEKGEGKAEGEKNIPNLYDYKFKRLFKYKPLSEEESRLGRAVFIEKAGKSS